MTTLVLGTTGQVGSHLSALLPDAVLWQRADADLSEPDGVYQAMLDLAPDVIVNASAYTAVDQAETEAEIAWQVNAASVTAIASAAEKAGAALIHISTDYVFDGRNAKPYSTDDAPHPLGVYGRTKLAGELAVQCLCTRHWILRTSWVFSEFGTNFVKTMLRLAQERDRLSVVGDQHGRPSYAEDVARLIVALVDAIGCDCAPAPGVYHLGGGPVTTWYDFAQEIFRRALAQGRIRTAPRVEQIPTTEYPTPARRPMNAALEPSHEFQSALSVAPDWQAGLERMLARLERKDATHG